MTVQLSNGYKLQRLGSTSASLPNVTSAWIKTSGSKSFSSGSVLGSSAETKISRSAQSHAFKKLKTPARCKECDSYLYFYGVECHECGLTVHKKCLSELNIFCPHKRLQKKPTFGSHLWTQALPACDSIPSIVAKCISEIDQRGRKIKGLYRVSGVKSKVEKLCSSFEHGADLVDLSDVHPNIIANVLKLYLRQLPEPLMTHRLYPEFIRVAKQFPASPAAHHQHHHLHYNIIMNNNNNHQYHNDVDDDTGHAEDVRNHDHSDTESTLSSIELQEIHQLVNLVSRLPKINYLTLAFIMHHLKRVADKSSENSMTSSNLGIVFGPTLMTASEDASTLSSLVDTVHHTRVIDLLITYAHQVFGSPLKVDATGRILGFADPRDLDISDSDQDDHEDEDDEGSDFCFQNRELIHQLLSKSPLSPPPVFTDFPPLSRSGKSMEFLPVQHHQQHPHQQQQQEHQQNQTAIMSMMRSSPVCSSQSQCLWDDSSIITLSGQKIVVSKTTSRPSPSHSPPSSSHCLRSLSPPAKSASSTAVFRTPKLESNPSPTGSSSGSTGASVYVTGNYTNANLPVAMNRSTRPATPHLLSPSQSFASSSTPTSYTTQSSLGSNISSSQSTLGSNSSDHQNRSHQHRHHHDEQQHHSHRQHPTQQRYQPSPSPQPEQHQNHPLISSPSTKANIHELRRQFFTATTPSSTTMTTARQQDDAMILDDHNRVVSNILRKDSSEDGSESEQVINRLTASAHHAKLKRASTGINLNRHPPHHQHHEKSQAILNSGHISHTVHFPSKCVKWPTHVHWDTRESDETREMLQRCYNRKTITNMMSDSGTTDADSNSIQHHAMMQYLETDMSLSRSRSANLPFSPPPEGIRMPEFV